MHKSVIATVIVSCLASTSFANSQSHTLLAPTIAKNHSATVLDLRELLQSDPSLALAVKNPQTGAITYTRDGLFLAKQGYFYQKTDRLQGYPVATDISVNDCKLIDLKAPDDEMPANPTANVMDIVNLNSASVAPSHIFNPADSSSFNFVSQHMIYDSLGNANNMAAYFIRSTAAANTWTVNIYVNDTAVGVGTLIFDSSGNLMSTSGLGKLTFVPTDGAASQTINFSVAGSTQFGMSSTVRWTGRDGWPAGYAVAEIVDRNGYATEEYSNEQSVTFGKIAVYKR